MAFEPCTCMLVAESVDELHDINIIYTWKKVAHKGMRHGPVGEHDRLNRCKQYPENAMSASTKGGASPPAQYGFYRISYARKTPHGSG